MKYYSVDRIEENIAVLTDDDGKIENIDISDFDFPVREGNILKFDGEKYIPDKEEEDRRRDKIKSLQNKLFGKRKDG